jgi:chemotaxis protein histidine kinase CheA
MNLEPELLQQLLATFRVELEEQLNTIFCAAHNIKEAAHGLGITSLIEIDNKLEYLLRIKV